MSRFSLTRKTSLLALALGLTALGSATVPAAAHFGSMTSALPHPMGGGFGNTGLGGLKQAFPAGNTLIGKLNSPVKVIGQKPASPTGSKLTGNIDSPVKVIGQATTGGSPFNRKPLGIKLPQQTNPGVGPINGQTIGNIDSPIKVSGPTPKPPNVGIDNICPFNKAKCPPAGSNPPPGPTTGSNPPMPGGGPTGPTGGGGQVSIQFPPVTIDPPDDQTQPVAVQPQVVAVQAPTNVVTQTTATPVAQPCNCLTEQHLNDGSVLFRNLCTKEAALATPAQSQALAAQ